MRLPRGVPPPLCGGDDVGRRARRATRRAAARRRPRDAPTAAAKCRRRRHRRQHARPCHTPRPHRRYRRRHRRRLPTWATSGKNPAASPAPPPPSPRAARPVSSPPSPAAAHAHTHAAAATTGRLLLSRSSVSQPPLRPTAGLLRSPAASCLSRNGRRGEPAWRSEAAAAAAAVRTVPPNGHGRPAAGRPAARRRAPHRPPRSAQPSDAPAPCAGAEPTTRGSDTHGRRVGQAADRQRDGAPRCVAGSAVAFLVGAGRRWRHEAGRAAAASVVCPSRARWTRHRGGCPPPSTKGLGWELRRKLRSDALQHRHGRRRDANCLHLHLDASCLRLAHDASETALRREEDTRAARQHQRRASAFFFFLPGTPLPLFSPFP